MTVHTTDDDTTIITGPHIHLFQLLAQRSAIRLEAKGYKRRGRSLTAVLKQHYGLRTRQQVLQRIEEEINHARANLP
jgi:hypothetical protein